MIRWIKTVLWRMGARRALDDMGLEADPKWPLSKVDDAPETPTTRTKEEDT